MLCRTKEDIRRYSRAISISQKASCHYVSKGRRSVISIFRLFFNFVGISAPFLLRHPKNFREVGSLNTILIPWRICKILCDIEMDSSHLFPWGWAVDVVTVQLMGQMSKMNIVFKKKIIIVCKFCQYVERSCVLTANVKQNMCMFNSVKLPA